MNEFRKIASDPRRKVVMQIKMCSLHMVGNSEQEFRFKPQRRYPEGPPSSGESVLSAEGCQRNRWFCFGE